MESPRQSESDSVEFWKNQAKYYEQKVVDIQHELDDYTENSAQLEKELEASLTQVEKHNRDLEHQNQRLKNEIEMLRNKLERSQHETHALENEIQALKIDKDKQGIYIRELEQKNDDLERGQRVISESVSCIESMLNQAYERNAVLESEVDELETLRVSLQRATDEARDLKQELKVMELVPKEKKPDDSTNDNLLANGLSPNPSRTQVEIETQTSLMSPQRREINGNAMTPSSRVTAINIVGDLLRKVGLERFLCRECGKVRCSCDASTAANYLPTNDNNIIPNNGLTAGNVEYRNQRVRHHSESENEILSKQPPILTQRSPEQSFIRSTAPESGKLRRSFAVRSREGLENLLNFSIRKNNDQNQPKQVQI